MCRLMCCHIVCIYNNKKLLYISYMHICYICYISHFLWDCYRVAKTHRIPWVADHFPQRATKYKSLLRKMTYKDKGSYESSPPCISKRQDIRVSSHVARVLWVLCHTYMQAYMLPFHIVCIYNTLKCDCHLNTTRHCVVISPRAFVVSTVPLHRVLWISSR